MRAIAVLAATALLALAGCGGSDKKSDTGTTARGYGDDAAAVTSTMKDYFAALVSGDGATVCGFFTDAAKQKIESAGAKCEDTVTQGVQSTGADAYKNPTLSTPTVSGSTATVHYSLKVQGKTVEADQKLTKVGGDWKLEAASPPGG